MKIEIKCRFNGKVLFEHTQDGNTLRLTLEAGVKASADLSCADLSCADLSCADLSCADLSYANLSGANLRCADLSCANLRCANLRGAYLYDGIKAAGKRPLLQIGPIGSAERTLFVWVTTKGLYLRAGCFWGTRDQFELAVEEEHGNSNHGNEYSAALLLADIHYETWKPTAEEIAELEASDEK